MSEPILDPEYWRGRLHTAQWPHAAVFKTDPDTWVAIEAKHRVILAGLVAPRDSVLDVGCGWGRLLTLMPAVWAGRYAGVDLSPDFIEMARRLHPTRRFYRGDAREVLTQLKDDPPFDLAVMVSIREMVRRNCEPDVWPQMEAATRDVARRLLYLEYDPTHPGSLE